MALELGGESQQRGVVEGGRTADGDRAGGRHTRADRGGGGTEATAVRYPVGADDLQAARLAAEPVEGRAHRPDHQVALVAGQRLGALTRDVHGESGVGDPDHDVVVQTQGESEGVEAGAEVGAGRGDPDPDGGGTERGTGHAVDSPGDLDRRASASNGGGGWAGVAGGREARPARVTAGGSDGRLGRRRSKPGLARNLGGAACQAWVSKRGSTAVHPAPSRSAVLQLLA